MVLALVTFKEGTARYGDVSVITGFGMVPLLMHLAMLMFRVNALMTSVFGKRRSRQHGQRQHPESGEKTTKYMLFHGFGPW